MKLTNCQIAVLILLRGIHVWETEVLIRPSTRQVLVKHGLIEELETSGLKLTKKGKEELQRRNL